MDPDTPVDISIFGQMYSPSNRQFSLQKLETLSLSIPNDGEETVTLSEGLTSGCSGSSHGVSFNICPVFIQVSISEGHLLPADVTAWSGVTFLNSSFSPEFTMGQCIGWSQSTHDATRMRRLQSCPPTENIVSLDVSYQFESMISLITRNREYHFTFMRYFHPTIGNCYRQSM